MQHLALGEHRVVDLTGHLGLAQSTVRKHLACLLGCGIVTVRARRWFWTLTVVAILLVGALSQEITAKPSPAVGAAIAVTGVALILVLARASRLMLAINRATLPSRRLSRRPRA